MDNNGIESLVRRILNSVNDDIRNSGNDGTNRLQGQNQNEQTISNSTQQELYRRFRIPWNNETQSESSSSTTNCERLSQQYNPNHNYGCGNSARWSGVF